MVCLLGCDDSAPLMAPPCNNLSTQPTWPVLAFKTDYTIQFPKDYQGAGLTSFEGNLFYKCNSDTSVLMWYSYCDPLHCDDFGDILSHPEAASLIIAVDSSSMVLDKKIFFCANDAHIGIYYSNESNPQKVVGRLFWKDTTDYREALSVSYTKAKEDDVIEILRTIQKK
jgi:hypothetical protein